MTVYTYDPDQQDTIVGGAPMTGWADGEFITVAFNANLYETIVGTDGDTTRVKVLDGSAIMTCKVMQTSRFNDFLSALVVLGRSSNGGADIFPVIFKDRGGTTLFTSPKCWIVKIPDMSRDKTAKAHEWQIFCTDAKMFLGGNG